MVSFRLFGGLVCLLARNRLEFSDEKGEIRAENVWINMVSCWSKGGESVVERVVAQDGEEDPRDSALVLQIERTFPPERAHLDM